MGHLESLMKRFGHLVSAGFYGTDDCLALQPPRYKELSIDLVSGATPERLAQTMKLVSEGVLETLPLITHRFPVEKAADAWELIESKSEPVLGVVLDWM
jgi:threonine dehydrogenase-like Zn-dependent dehydrogenase